MEDKKRIRQLNDVFRQTGASGRILVTPAVRALNDIDQTKLLYLVREFNNFSTDNDPHGEHDFGIVKLHGESYYWKIDYYDRALKWGSENPADPDKTTRVMTILHSHEY